MTDPLKEKVAGAVERAAGMEKRLAYQGALAKHYTGDGATNAIERKLCEEAGKDAEAIRTLLSALDAANEREREAVGHLRRCVLLVPAPGAIEAAEAFLARTESTETDQ